MKKNFKFAWFFFCTLLAILPGLHAPQAASASSPENISLKYNPNAQILLVTITHDSMFPGSHYIKFVEIKKNGATVSINSYSSQPSEKTFTYTYRIPAIEDDTFVVDCTCNVSGKKSSPTFTVR
jgi:hypothetical protein